MGVPTKHILHAIHGFSHIRFWGIMKIGQAFFLGALINGTIEVILIWYLGSKYLQRKRKKAIEFIKRVL